MGFLTFLNLHAGQVVGALSFCFAASKHVGARRKKAAIAGAEESLRASMLSLNDLIVSFFRSFVAARMLSLSLFSVILTLLRYHLFIWSVLTPKLLFEIVQTALSLFLWLLAEVAVAIGPFVLLFGRGEEGSPRKVS